MPPKMLKTSVSDTPTAYSSRRMFAMTFARIAASSSGEISIPSPALLSFEEERSITTPYFAIHPTVRCTRLRPGNPRQSTDPSGHGAHPDPRLATQFWSLVVHRQIPLRRHWGHWNRSSLRDFQIKVQG